jgi:hypothetical protein
LFLIAAERDSTSARVGVGHYSNDFYTSSSNSCKVLDNPQIERSKVEWNDSRNIGR